MINGVLYPNQEQYYNALGIYDMENDLRMRVGSEIEAKVRKTLLLMIKRFGKDSLYNNDKRITQEIIEHVYDMITKEDDEVELDLEEDSCFIEDYIEYLIS